LIKLGKDLSSPLHFMVQAFHEKREFKKMIQVLKIFKEKIGDGNDSIYQKFKVNIMERVRINPSSYSIDDLIEYSFFIYF
jgi:hypothetical protein